MARQQHQERKIEFKSVQLFKGQTLGIGSYGAVCKAKCDDLLCAAKILHPTLFDPTTQLQVSPKQEHTCNSFRVFTSRIANINGAWNARNSPYCDLIGPYQILVMSRTCTKYTDVPRPFVG